MEFGRKPKGVDWLKGHQTATATDLSNDIWVRIERVNRVLEKYGRGDFVHNMPVLFAMYYYAVVTLMQIPEKPTGQELQKLYRENLLDIEEDCLIEEGGAARMVEEFHAACQSLADAYVADKKDTSKAFNPVTPIITATAKLLDLPYQDIHMELAHHLADFAVSYRVGDPAKKYPLKSE